MCRFTLYLGPPIRLATLITEPEHSLIYQSYHAAERTEPLNGDGFGVGWYQPTNGKEPGVFRSITPAWNNENLHSLARVISSPCIMAHVRAATPGSAVNTANCHPFQFGRYLLMHNGHIGNFSRVRRPLLESVGDVAFNHVFGSTDTEHLFALFVDELLSRGGEDPGRDLMGSLVATIFRTLELVRSHGDGAPSSLNIAVSDGDEIAVTRFSDDPDRAPESLYFIHQELYEPAFRGFPGRRRHERSESVVVSSERLTDDPAWQAVPPNHLVCIRRDCPAKLLRLEDGKAVEA